MGVRMLPVPEKQLEEDGKEYKRKRNKGWGGNKDKAKPHLTAFAPKGGAKK